MDSLTALLHLLRRLFAPRVDRPAAASIRNWIVALEKVTKKHPSQKALPPESRPDEITKIAALPAFPGHEGDPTLIASGAGRLSIFI